MRRENRLTSPADFQTVYRSGMRSRAASVVAISSSTGASAPKIGFAASKKVGPAIQRNRAKRRLRAAITPLVPSLRGHLTVLQATPRTASQSWQELESELRTVLVGCGALDA